MINNESSISSEQPVEKKKRDIAAPAIAIGGVISAIAAQRVGDTNIRMFSTITGMAAAGFGGSAYAVGRLAHAKLAALKPLHPSVATSRVAPQFIDLTAPAANGPASKGTDELTVVIDLEKASVPRLIDLSAADQTVDA
jgi:hypothetical protein